MTKLNKKNNIINPIENELKTQFSNVSYTRTPFWLEDDNQSIFCWLHLPSNNTVYNTGVVICNPIGYEYSHTHRSIRHLADHLAENGYPTIRFDYHGTGDSPSNLFEEKRIPTFLKNIDFTIKYLKERTGVNKICLIGLRLGASLAAEYCKNSKVDQLILWSCYAKGRSYVRETKALEKLASHFSNINKDFIDSGGFVVTSEIEKDLTAINLLKQNYKINNKMLIIERNDIPSTGTFFEKIQSQNKVIVEKYLMANYSEMMAEPHETIIPKQVLLKISNWLNQQNKAPPVPLSKNQLNDMLTTTINRNKQYTEYICLEEESHLMGILSCPTTRKQDDDRPLILLVNSGSVHRVGPNRLYVELARNLSISGYSALRFDLSNLGDSVIGQPNEENCPYPQNATHDIFKMMSYMEQQYGYKKFILAGLCSGAYSVFHAGLNLPVNHGVCEVLMINPLTIYRKTDNAGNSILSYQIEKDSEQYSRSLISIKKWKKLVSGKADFWYIIIFSVKRFFRAIYNKLKIYAETLGIYTGSQLSKDLQRYVKNGTKINFFIASKDPGKRILMSQAKKTIENLKDHETLNIYEIPKSDHTFSEYYCRQSFVKIFVKHINKHY